MGPGSLPSVHTPGGAPDSGGRYPFMQDRRTLKGSPPPPPPRRIQTRTALNGSGGGRNEPKPAALGQALVRRGTRLGVVTRKGAPLAWLIILHDRNPNWAKRGWKRFQMRKETFRYCAACFSANHTRAPERRSGRAGGRTQTMSIMHCGDGDVQGQKLGQGCCV